MIVKKILTRIKISICKKKRDRFILPYLRKNLVNDNFSVISSTCNGGVLCSDLGVRFNSPFVNLFIYPEDFIKILADLEFYMSCELEEMKNNENSFPVGVLNDEVKIYFMHYGSFNEAKEKWDLRKRRINYDNLFIIMTDRDGCTEAHIRQFDKLPYKKKIIFTSKPFQEYRSVVYCEEYREYECVPVLTEWRGLSGERLYDRYMDFVGWLNS